MQSNPMSTFQPGQPFNPCRQICGFYPPDVVGRQRDLKDGPKRLYDRLVRWAGQRGTCWYCFESMADALGKSVRQVKSDMQALERHGLIAHEVRGWKDGKRQTNVYCFLWHAMFETGKVACSPLHRNYVRELRKELCKKNTDSDFETMNRKNRDSSSGGAAVCFPQTKTIIETALEEKISDKELARVVEASRHASDAELASAIRLAVQRSPSLRIG